LAACRLHGLQRVPAHDQVHVLVPHERRRRSEGFLLVERTGRMLPAVSRDGIRCAPLVRALIDGARRLDRIDEVRALLCEAVQLRWVTVPALRAELEAGSARGSALVRTVIVELEDGIRSAAEAWQRELVATMAGFPEVHWNADGTSRAAPSSPAPTASSTTAPSRSTSTRSPTTRTSRSSTPRCADRPRWSPPGSSSSRSPRRSSGTTRKE
jgi:hypothetical protein